MRKTLFTAVMLFLVSGARSADGELPPFTVRLFQPNPILVARIGDSAAPLAEYIKALDARNTTFWKSAVSARPKGLLIAVGVKPGKVARVWCEPVEGTVPKDTLARLEEALASVPPLEVKGGPLAFALEVTLAEPGPRAFPELPLAWQKVSTEARSPLLVPDGIFAVLWP
jgi:hypothetical protein